MRVSVLAPAVLFLSVSLQAARAQSIVSTQAVRNADSLSTPRTGDKVTIAGRIVLGSGVLDTAQMTVFVQDGTGSVLVDADVPSPWITTAVGDSVIATGTIERHGASQGFLDDAVVRVVPAQRTVVDAVPLGRLVPARLAAVGSRLVTLEAVVVHADVGRGDHGLTVGDTITDGSYLTVFESGAGNVALRLDRFGLGDRIRLTGVLVKRVSPATGLVRYALYPRAATDVQALGMTGRERLALLRAAAIAAALALGGGGGWWLLRRRRHAQVRAHRELEERAARYRTLVDQAPIGIVVHRNGRIVFANHAFRALAATPDVDDTRVSDLITVDGRGIIPDQATFTRAVLQRPGREPIDVEVASSAITYGSEVSQQLLVHDASQRAQAERSLAATEAKLRHSQRLEALGQLAAGVAHDFNNVLTAIKGNAGFLLEGCTNCGVKAEEAAEIDAAADRAAALTRQLLAFGRRRQSAPQVLVVDSVIRNLQSLLRRLVPESVHQTFALGAADLQVRADPGQLEQVIVNLVVNARDAMPAGGLLTVSTTRVVVAAADPAREGLPSRPGTYVCISVRDTGIGMDEATRAKVFEPFFTTKAPGQGTGLGLSTVDGIIEQHEGFVFIDSVLGRGTTFHVFLPAAERTAEEPTREPVAAATPGVGGTILLVEDEPAIRQLVDRALTGAGHTVLLAKDGLDALAVARSYHGEIQLLITDIGLPGLNGPEIASHLTRAGRVRRVLYISGHVQDRIAGMSPRSPETEILPKPFSPQDVVRRVQAVLGATALATV